MTPLEYYQKQCSDGVILPDQEQLRVMHLLEKIYTALLNESHARKSIFSFFRKPHLIKGMYLWGSVGIGKTFMMDCFYNSLPFPQKKRMHFHQFMQMVHQELKKQQGKKDPLPIIAKQIARNTLLLCFDELFVSDITDAMLIARLFKALFAEGVSLVTTSNMSPDDLYKNGLQREQFLPAIALFKEHTQVVHVSSAIDYRLRHLKEAGVFYSPLNEKARQNMEKSFLTLTEGMKISSEPLMILGRAIPVVKKAEDVVWFDFNDICTVPRSQNDYLAIAKGYRTVLISDIPIIPSHAKDMICLFVSLVDVFYDARVRLVISAAEPVTELYSRGYMILEYTRTHSRLLEMQSTDYFLNT
ncbi:MAG: hypothetical protein ACD_60C00122G0013 [uncultured bacterium]|nr:MAG: hypothetical protein ACD_60C00122G0013 [uncultured bacterium]